jgi:hypothetical protein
LWGAIETGFVRSGLPFEWWSYTTLVLVAVGCCTGLVGYRLMKTKRESAKRLVFVDLILTLGALVFYVLGLAYTFAAFFQDYTHFWMAGTTDARYVVGIYSLFHSNFPFTLGVAFLEFLSAGSFLSVLSSPLLAIVLRRLMKTPSAKPSDSAQL